MARVLLLTHLATRSVEVLPALELLAHRVDVVDAAPAALLQAPEADVVLVDARGELAAARSLARMLHASGRSVPLLAVVTEGGLSAVSHDWGVDDVLLDSAGPAEVEARLRLAAERAAAVEPGPDEPIRAGDVTIDEASYAVRAGGRLLDLTFIEFELLKYLAQHPGRVFTREHLLREVWGHDYFGGTRTVDVHVRRLRAKLGPEQESLIGTVRNVGYRFVLAGRGAVGLPVDEGSPAPPVGEPRT
ncbi:MAG TPA: response regulator transcription factor [Segeticoccus sp.]|nr:response regulator transcription factor [Segeticoccus sp.]